MDDLADSFSRHHDSLRVKLEELSAGKRLYGKTGSSRGRREKSGRASPVVKAGTLRGENRNYFAKAYYERMPQLDLAHEFFIDVEGFLVAKS